MTGQLQPPPIINQSGSTTTTSQTQMANDGETSVSKSDSDPNPGTESRPQPESISIVVSRPPLEDKAAAAAAASKGFLPRDESYHEQCRVCQQQSEELLMELGCKCRGDLAKAHKSCIQLWFQTRGSNTCEICQQVAANVPPPNSQPTTNYWVWRVDSTYGGRINLGRGGRVRVCISPLWVAFSILIGGLLLDVLISVSLGVSALPVNIIIGVLIILGLATAFRLGLECCHEWNSRRHAQREDFPVNAMAHPSV